MVKIAFIGSHGVGKTTLCYDLAAALKKQGVTVDMVKEVARLSPLPINRQTSLEAQMWILSTQIAEEIRSAATHEVVVCDRSVLDNYAYLVFATSRQRWLEPLVNRWMKGYDILFKVPIAGSPSADGVRDTDEFFMRSIDAPRRRSPEGAKARVRAAPRGPPRGLGRDRQGAGPGPARSSPVGCSDTSTTSCRRAGPLLPLNSWSSGV